MLGPHRGPADAAVLAYLPHAAEVTLDTGIALQRVHGSDFFLWRGEPAQLPEHYRLHWRDAHGEHSRHPDDRESSTASLDESAPRPRRSVYGAPDNPQRAAASRSMTTST